jgi:signal transduction histidine kinase/CheY-like chemotaxis protein
VDALRQMFGRLTAAEQRMEATRTADADRSAAQASDFAIAGLLGSLLVIGVLAVFLGRSLVTPLGRLGAAADRMASGDLSARVSPRGPVELAELAYSFNAMAEALERGQAELVEASKQADQANHAKSEFLSRMSHELRTPLNAVLGFGQLLEMEGLDDRQQEYVGYVLKGGKHLLALIDEVLELSRIETGQLAISPEPVPLGETVNEVVTLVKPLAAEKHVEISADLSGLTDDGHVHADRQRLKQVLLNLLSNAIKYNRPDGRVQITLAKSSEGRVRIVVDDTGIGIPPDRLAAAFEPFERLGAELTEIEGTGLGLALSKRLVEAMGGSITIRSEPGSGTTFTVELDAVAPPDAIDGAGSTPQRPHVTGGEAGSQRILYVEDNLSNLKLVERVLDGQPAVELVPAMMAMLGLELAREHRPDLIVLDLHLPDMPGEQLLQRLKADAATATIPVIVLTADATKRQREHLLQLGALEYLTKPLDVHRFLDVVASALGWTPSE